MVAVVENVVRRHLCAGVGAHRGRGLVHGLLLSCAHPRGVGDQPVEVDVDTVERVEHAALDRVAASATAWSYSIVSASMRVAERVALRPHRLAGSPTR